MKTARLLSVPLLLLLASPSVARAAVIAGFDSARHSRFLAGGAANPGFLLAGMDLSGVAGNPGSFANRAVLVTPQHYITAAHASTAAPTFRGSDGVFRTYTASSFVDLTTNFSGGGTGTSDIRIYTLDAPIPGAHGVSPLALLEGDPANLLGHDFFVIGQNNQAGRNVIDDVVLASFGGGASPSFTIQYSYDTDSNGGTGGLGADEAGLIGGDSGHSALLRIGDELAFVGTHFGIDDPTAAASGDVYQSFSTMVIPYLDEISTITMNDGFAISTLTVTAVPEPSAGVALVVIGLAAVRRSRGRRK